MKRFMAKVSKSFKGGQKGFTLIELLIVIVILGVLAAAIIPNLSKFIGAGDVGAANAELASVRTGVAAFMAKYDALPTGDTSSPYAVDPADIDEFITGTIKGLYYIDADGLILDADPNDWNPDRVGWDCATVKWADADVATACP